MSQSKQPIKAIALPQTIATLRAYQFRKDWSQIRRWGDETAKSMGIESYDDVEKIAG